MWLKGWYFGIEGSWIVECKGQYCVIWMYIGKWVLFMSYIEILMSYVGILMICVWFWMYFEGDVSFELILMSIFDCTGSRLGFQFNEYLWVDCI